MMVVVLGTNRFVDCRALLGFQGTDLLVVQPDPLQVTLRVPESASLAGSPVVIEGGIVTTGQGLAISADPGCFAIYADDVLAVVAVRRDAETIHLKVDLRPLGLQIYDDVDGLHIGSNSFARNEIRNAGVAITLG